MHRYGKRNEGAQVGVAVQVYRDVQLLALPNQYLVANGTASFSGGKCILKTNILHMAASRRLNLQRWKFNLWS